MKNKILMRIIKNAGLLLSGDVLYGIAVIISTVLAARALGPKHFGILVTIQAYTIVVDRLVNFQSWPVVIKYGTECLHKNLADEFKQLLKVSFLLDGITALFGFFIAVIGMLIYEHIKPNPGYLSYAMLYCVVIVTNITGTFIALLRLNDRFKLFTFQKIFVSIFKLMFTVVAYWKNASFFVFFLIWFSSDILINLLICYFGIMQLHHMNLLSFYKVSLRGISKNFYNLKEFFISTNLASSIRMLSREFDVLILTIFLGSSAAGLFKIAKVFSSIPNKIFEPFFYSIYPEFAKIFMHGNKGLLKTLVFRTAYYAGIGASLYFIVFYLFGTKIILVTAGQQYIGIRPAMLLYLFATVFAGIAMPFSPALLAAGLHKAYLLILVFSTFIYFIVLPFCLNKFSILGASLGYVIFYVIYLALIWVYFNKVVLSSDNPLSGVK